MTDEPKITLKVKVDNILQMISNKVTSWSNTPSNDNYPSEKLVKDSLDGKASTDSVNSLSSSLNSNLSTIYSFIYNCTTDKVYHNSDLSNLGLYGRNSQDVVNSKINDNIGKLNKFKSINVLGTHTSTITNIMTGDANCSSTDLGDGFKISYTVPVDSTTSTNAYLKLTFKGSNPTNNFPIKSKGQSVPTNKFKKDDIIDLQFDGTNGVWNVLNHRVGLFSTVATTGSYNDLSNKPTIPTVPTNISSFTNDSGFITSSQAKQELYTDLYDVMDCINVNFNNLDDIYLLDTVFDISNYNGLPSKNSSVVNDILRNNAVSQIGLNKEFTPSTKYTLEFDYYTSVSNRNGFYFGADPSLENGVSINNSDDGLQVIVDISNTYVETFNGTSSLTRVYTHTSNLLTEGTHHIRIVRNNTNVVFYIDDVELYTYTNAKYNTIGLNKWGGGYNTISNIEIKIGG